MLRRIALSGLKGRPRQTRILLVTLGLAFFFVTLSLILLGTSNTNREINRLTTFGEWGAVYINEPEEVVREMVEEIPSSAVLRVAGRDDRFGLVATADEKFWEMSHIRLLEGELPTGIDEIALEVGQLSYFPQTPEVGDTILLNLILLMGEDDSDDQNQRMIEFGEEIQSRLRLQMAEVWEEMPAALERRKAEEYFWVPAESDIADYLRETGMSYEEYLESSMAHVEERYARLFAFFEEDPGTVEGRLAKIITSDEQEIQARTQYDLQNEEFRAEIRSTLGSGVSEGDIDSYIIEELHPINQVARMMRYISIRRNTTEIEGLGQTSLQTRMRYLMLDNVQSLIDTYAFGIASWLPPELYPDFSDLMNVPIRHEVALIRRVTLSGIIEDYHSMWDGPTNLYPNAFISEQTGSALLDEGLFKSDIPDNQNYEIFSFVFVDQEQPALVDPPSNYFENRLSKDAASGISEDLISSVLLLVFALITGFSVFQISLVQLKKRQRKFALMRSVGATLSQIRRIMSWEAVYLLLLSLPVGTIAGFIAARLIIWANNAMTGETAAMTLQPLWIILGIGATLLASLIGLFLPLRHLERIPLRGQVDTIDRAQTKKARDILGERAMRRQTLSSINRRHYRFIRKQRWIGTLLYSLILFILLGSLWLVYLSFGEYRAQVIDSDMPDFEFTRSYQQSRQINRILAQELEDFARIERADMFIKGEKAFLWYEGIEENELTHYFLEMLPPIVRYDYFSSTRDFLVEEEHEHLMKEAILADVFGVDPESDYGRRLRQTLPAGFDWESFTRGQEVILLSPGYRLLRPAEPVSAESAEMLGRAERMKGLFESTRSARISYDYRRVGSLDVEPSFEGLESFTLTIPTGLRSGRDNIPLNTVNIYEMEVGAVLHALPPSGMWPLSQTMQNPIVIVSSEHIQRLYPHRVHSYGDFRFYAQSRVSWWSERYGTTMLHLYMPNPTLEEALEVKRLGLSYDFIVNNLYLVKERLYDKGFQTSLIVGLLGLALLVIALQIQTTSAKGLLETERARIGILQSIGIQAKEYRRAYFKDALLRILAAVLITHVALLIAIALYLLIAAPGADLLLEMQISLSAYPYLIHLLIVLGFLVLGTMAAFLPLGRILKRQPVENIRSLN